MYSLTHPLAHPLPSLLHPPSPPLYPPSQGYASMEYSVSGYRENDLCRLDILIAGEPALPLAAIVHREEAHGAGKLLTHNLNPKPNLSLTLTLALTLSQGKP